MRVVRKFCVRPWLVVWLLVRAFVGAAADSTERRLVASSTLLETAAGGESREYGVTVPRDHALELSIAERRGMAGLLVVVAPDGRELVQADLGRRHPAARTVLVPPGASRVRIGAPNHGTVDRIFEIRIGEARPITEPMRLRIAAEQLLGEGESAYRRKNPGYLNAALTAYEKSLALWRQLGDTAREADVLDHAAYVRYEQGEMKSALDTYRRALDIWTPRDDRAGVAAALQGMALVAGDTGDQANAERWANQALDIRRSLSDARGQAETLFVLNAVQFITARSDEARTSLTNALTLAQQAGDRVREADALNFFGVLENMLGHHKEAAEFHTRALAIDREENEPVRAAQRLSNLGSVLGSAGEIRESIEYLHQALPVRRALASPNAYGNTLYNLGISHAELGEYQKALDEYKEALALFRRTVYPRGEGFVLRALGDLYLATGEHAKAEHVLQQAAARWRSISDRRGEVLALNSLGELAARRHDPSGAMARHRQALEIAHNAGYQREEQQTRGYLAKTTRATGELRLSLDHASQELALARQIGDKLGEADALHQQGAAWRRLGEQERSRDALEHALDLRDTAGARVLEADTLDELARLERDAGRLAEAADRVDRALTLIETVGATAGDRESRMRFAAAHRQSFDLAIDLAMRLGHAEQAFALSERARARGLVDLMREARLDIRRGIDPRLLARERRVQEVLDAKHERFTRLLASPHSAAREATDRRELDELVEKYQAVEAEIRLKSPRYAALMQPTALSLEDVQSRLLDADTALVEFWLGEERSYAWVVTARSCRGVALPPWRRIGVIATRAYRALNARNEGAEESPERREARVSAADAEFSRGMADLSRLLLRPLGRLRQRRLWIVSDGELEYLPFAAFPAPDGAGPLVATHDIVRLPSISVLAVVREEIAHRPPASRTVAVFADPVFGADDERVTKAERATVGGSVARGGQINVNRLPRLHFSRQEADAIVTLAPSTSRAALDFDASRREATRPDVGRYRVVHFATHGVLDSRHPELSGIALSMVDPSGQPQDGFLRLHEIYNLRLSADLVVLSACQTALGQDVRSEGLVGLVRGFMYAGSPQVLASLWSVRDRATAEFMRLFYEGLLTRRLAPEAALRAAQLSMMNDARWSRPYYWAAFTLQGER